MADLGLNVLKIKKRFLLVSIMISIFMMSGLAGAVVNETAPAQGLIEENQTAKASSDLIPMLQFFLDATDNEKLMKVAFTIESVGGSVPSSAIPHVALYYSSDATLNPAEDTRLGFKNDGTNIDNSMELTVADINGHPIPSLPTDGRYYIAIRTGSTWSDSSSHAIRMRLIGGDNTFYVSSGSNPNATLLETNTLIADTTTPDVDLSYDPSNVTTVSDAINITAQFTESVSDSPLISIMLNGDTLVSSATMMGSGDNWYYNYTNVTNTGSGYANVIITAYDLAGNVNSTPTNATFLIDNADPSVTLDTVSQDQWFKTSGIWFNGTYNDDDSGINNSTFTIQVFNKTSNAEVVGLAGSHDISGTPWLFNYSEILTEGLYNVTVSVDDFVGLNAITTVDFGVDLTSPVIVIDSQLAGMNFSSWADISINGTYSDAGGSGIDVDSLRFVPDALGSSIHNDGTLLKNDTTFNLTFTEQQALNIHPNLQNGTFNVGVHINDNATNLKIAEVGPFKVDPIAPEISLDTVSEGQYFNTVTPAIWFNGTYSDNLVGINASTFAYALFNSSGLVSDFEFLEGGIHTDELYNYSAAFDVEDVYNISFAISDYVYNTDVTFANFTVDWTAPVIALDTMYEGMNVTPANVAFNGTYTDNVAGVDNSTLGVKVYNVTSNELVGSAGGTDTTSNFNYTYPGLADGDYNVTIEVDDNAGNLASFVANFTVDSVAPVITLDSITEGMNISSGTVVFNGTYSDDSGVDDNTLDIRIYNTISNALVDIVTTGTSTADHFNYTYSGLADGRYNVSVSVSDIPGNVDTTSVNFTVDATDPSLTLDTISEGVNLTDNLVWFNGTYSDEEGTGVNLSSLVLMVNGTVVDEIEPGASAYNHSITLADGAHNVSVSVSDYAGNTNTTGTVNFRVDTVDPVVTLDTISEGVNLTESLVWFNGTYSDAGAGINTSSLAILVNGAEAELTGTANENSYNHSITLSDGDYNVSVSVSDYAGLTDTTELVNFTVDVTDPSLTLDTISAGVKLTDDLVWFNGTYSDDVTGVNLSSLVLMVNGTAVDEIAFKGASAYSHSITLADGAHNVSVSVSDYAGNTNTTGTVNFRVDTVDPVVTLDTISEGVNLTESLVWFNGTYSDAGAGINTSSLAILVNGADAELTGTANENSYNHSITLSDGDYNVSVSVSDYAGLTKTTELVNFTVDATDPSLTLDTISQNVNLKDNLVWFNGTYSDDVTGVNLSSLVLMVNGTAVDVVEPGASAYNHSITLADGAHNVSVSVSDYAGNPNTTGTINFEVDTDTPSLTLDTISEGDAFATNDLWVNGTYSDAGIGSINTSSLVILVNGVAEASINTVNEDGYNHNITLSDGSHNVWVSVSDDAGNTNTTGVVNFTTDTTPPASMTGVTVEDLQNAGRSLNVSWDKIEVEDFASYNIYISRLPITDVSGMTPEANVADVNTTTTPLETIDGDPITDGVEYYVAVAANDTVGNQNDTVVSFGPVKSFPDMTLTLEQGWNLVSVPGRLDNSSTEDVFGERYVFYYDAASSAEIKWDTSPENIVPCRGYWVYNANDTVDSVNLLFEYMPVDGSVPKIPPTQDLVAGWNMIGHTSADPINVTTSLASITGSYSNLLRYSGSEGWERYINAELNEIEQMNAGEGYWIFMTENKTYAAIDAYYENLPV
ncbi:beta strand repeat-containing protein [Methanolobus sp. WCC5]|uniref:beta strand repeat-containing protein n=1 Tax=Methanolobus sp. WCC5 TaxID=3125785 RepID=UPI00324EAD39